MFRLDLICLTNSGISAARITRVRPMIDSAQAAAGRRAEDRLPNSWWQPTRIDRDHVVQRRHDEAADVAEEVDHSGSC